MKVNLNLNNLHEMFSTCSCSHEVTKEVAEVVEKKMEEQEQARKLRMECCKEEKKLKEAELQVQSWKTACDSGLQHYNNLLRTVALNTSCQCRSSMWNCGLQNRFLEFSLVFVTYAKLSYACLI